MKNGKPTDQLIEKDDLTESRGVVSRAAVLGCSHETLRQWYLAVASVFEPRRQSRPVVAVDETTVSVAGRAVYVWAALDVQSFELVYLAVTPGRSSLAALLFLRAVLEYCRGKPVFVVDHGPWYTWAFETPECRWRNRNVGHSESRRIAVLPREIPPEPVLAAFSPSQ